MVPLYTRLTRGGVALPLVTSSAVAAPLTHHVWCRLLPPASLRTPLATLNASIAPLRHTTSAPKYRCHGTPHLHCTGIVPFSSRSVQSYTFSIMSGLCAGARRAVGVGLRQLRGFRARGFRESRALRSPAGSHSSTSQLNLSRVWHKKTPYTPLNTP